MKGREYTDFTLLITRTEDNFNLLLSINESNTQINLSLSWDEMTRLYWDIAEARTKLSKDPI